MVSAAGRAIANATHGEGSKPLGSLALTQTSIEMLVSVDGSWLAFGGETDRLAAAGGEAQAQRVGARHFALFGGERKRI